MTYYASLASLRVITWHQARNQIDAAIFHTDHQEHQGKKRKAGIDL
jgi:hypothetical protein